MSKAFKALHQALAARYADPPAGTTQPAGVATLARLAARGSCRAFKPDPVSDELIDLLCAVALAAPSKSDLQQRDLIRVVDPELRDRLNTLAGGQDWVAAAPAMLVFCGNNNRQRRLHEWRGRAFANDHLDAFFNAAVDAAIALAAFVTAAEVQPYEKQRYTTDFGRSKPYTWSEDKTRQYAKPERTGFGGFIRRKGFSLD